MATRYISMKGSGRLTVREFDALNSWVLHEGEASLEVCISESGRVPASEARAAYAALRKLYDAAIDAGWSASPEVA